MNKDWKKERKPREQRVLDMIESVINSMTKGPFIVSRRDKRAVSSFKKARYVLTKEDRMRLEQQRKFEDERKRRRNSRRSDGRSTSSS